MFPPEGRIEKRIPLAIPVEISKLWDPAGGERTTTENVCSSGVLVLTAKALEPKEQLMVRFLESDLQVNARVVYRQRMPDGRNGVGLQFRRRDVNSLGDILRGR